MVNGAQPDSIKEWKRMLEETKREVRTIKAEESQLKWKMTREDKKERFVDAKKSVEEVRDWRFKQREEMKALEAEIEIERKANELKESFAFQKFKRDNKTETGKEERKQITEELEKDTENAQWRAELLKAVHLREKELTKDAKKDFEDIRDIRNLQKEQDRVETNENRAIEQTLEMAAIAREIAKEKEELLQTLELSRLADKKAATRSYLAPTAALGQLS